MAETGERGSGKDQHGLLGEQDQSLSRCLDHTSATGGPANPVRQLTKCQSSKRDQGPAAR